MFAKEHFALQTEICTYLKNNNTFERVLHEPGEKDEQIMIRLSFIFTNNAIMIIDIYYT